MDSPVISLHDFRQTRFSAERVRNTQVIAVTGGKGGVGKSFVAANLAAVWASAGSRTLAVDADFGMADLNLLLGVAPEHSVLDLLCGTAIQDVLVQTHGFDLLPGLNGSTTLANLDARERLVVLAAIDSLEDAYDVCVIDAPPGISDAGVDMAAAASHVVVILSPEPVSLADAYASLKAMCVRHELRRAYVVVNNVESAADAEETLARLQTIVDRFLGVELVAMPHIPRDSAVSTTCAMGIPVVHHCPDSPASRAIKALARKLSQSEAVVADDPMRLFRNRVGTPAANCHSYAREASKL